VAAWGRWLMAAGAVALALGGLLRLLARWYPTGIRLPGDIVWRRPGFTLILPLGTSLLVSALLTLLLWALSAMGRR
jgi:hypothetical protein